LLIKEVFEQGKKKLGWRSVQMALRNKHGITMNHKKIRRIMKIYNLQCKIRRKNPYKAIMKKTQEHRTFENILNRQFNQCIPRKALCADITYLYYGAGRRAYLSAIKDIASGEALSWEVSMKTVQKLEDAELLLDTLLHSDQGFHYTNPLYISTLQGLGITQSMSRKANCIDNAPMESFFGHFKDELEFKDYQTFEELKIKVDQYMHYYNNVRYPFL
jgi:transposase InsO family protein